MRAANAFVADIRKEGIAELVHRLRVELYGSLGATGKGHGSDVAILMGLEGENPQTVDTDQVAARVEHIRASRSLKLGGERPVRFVEKDHKASPSPARPLEETERARVIRATLRNNAREQQSGRHGICHKGVAEACGPTNRSFDRQT